MRPALRLAAGIGTLLVLVGAAVGVGGSVPAPSTAHSRASGAASTTRAALVAAETRKDSRASRECGAWLAPGGGGPVGATVTSALDATAADVRALLAAQHLDASADVNVKPLAPSDYAAVCVFDVSKSIGFGDAKQLTAYATPENQGIGLISLR